MPSVFDQLTKWLLLVVPVANSAFLLLLVFKAGRIVQTVEEIKGNHLPHIYDELKTLRENFLALLLANKQ